MFFFGKPLCFRYVNRIVRLYSMYKKNHYDVLNLRSNCSDKEIKDAFIKMSKVYHPDINKDHRAQETFVKIVEAYNVLSKPSTRAQYDSMREVNTNTVHSTPYTYRAHASAYHRPNTQYNYYNYAYQSQSNTAGSTHTNDNTSNDNVWYYGLKGIKKLRNTHIFLICLGLAGIGVILQLIIVRTIYIHQQGRAKEKSQRIAEELQRVREKAVANGNELQTRLLLDKIVTAANPTVTTASLGQALANEKKENAENLLTEFGVADPQVDSPLYEDARSYMKEVNMKLLSI